MYAFKQPSFAGIKYATQAETINHTNNIQEGNYLGNEGSRISTYGSKARKIQQTAYIEIAKDNGKKNRKFLRALEGKRGILILPYSQLQTQVVVESWSVDIGLTVANYAIYSINFIVDSYDVIPLPVKSKKGLFDKYKDKLLGYYSTHFESKWKSVSGKYMQYKKVAEKVADVGTKMNEIAQKIRTASDGLSTFQIEVAKFTNDVASLVNSPVDLIYSIESSIAGLVISASDMKNTFLSLVGLTDKQSSVLTTDNAGNIATEIQNNEDLINGMIYLNAISECAIALQEMEFTTATELDYYRNLMKVAFHNMPTNIDDDTRLTLVQMDTDIELMFQEMSQGLQDVETVSVPKTNLIALNYALYGNIDNYDNIVALNSLQSGKVVNGDIQVLY